MCIRDRAKFSMGEGTAGVLSKGFSYESATNTFNVKGELIATENVLNNAITLTSTAYTAASMALTSSWQTVQSLAITTTGKTVIVMVSSGCEFDTLTSGQSVQSTLTIAFRLLLDGVEVATSVGARAKMVVDDTWGPAYVAASAGTASFTFSSMPAAGVHTYTLQANFNFATANLGFVNSRSMFAMELKK